MIEIEYLVDVPYYLHVVASWVFREWCREDGSVEKVLSRYKQRLSRGRIPLTLVALRDGTPVGIISLVLDELPTRPDLFPWLGSLYVVPGYRGNGIGRLLVRRAEFIAQELGVGMLFVFTDSLGDLCEKEGWVYIGDEPDGNNRNVSVFGKNYQSP
jgi:GNAT superfamily N-acetyltransferase